jgi:chemotaxis signal transduction protein
MLRLSLGRKQKSHSQACHLLVFSVGGRRLAATIEEIARISEWKGSIPVPSRTPFVSAVVRNHDEILPVFNLAELFGVCVQGENPFCITAKHPSGSMAICVDGDMPILQTIDRVRIQPYRDGEFEAVGSFANGSDEIPIISFAHLCSA